MNGNKVLDKSYGGTSDESVGFIIKGLGKNEILIGGNSVSGISGDKTEGQIGSYDCWIVSIDTAGNINWQETIGGSDWEGCSDAVRINNNIFLFAGASESGIGFDKTESNRGEYDFWLVELTLSTVGLAEKPKASPIRMYPNPARELLHFDIGNITSESMELKVMDMTGKMVMEKDIHHTTANVDVTEFISGIYLFNLFSNGQLIASKKVVVE